MAKRTQELVAAQYRCWNESVLPQLAAAGIQLLKHRRTRPRRSWSGSIGFSANGPFRFSRRWPSTRPIPARATTTAACIWPRCSSVAAVLGPKQLFAVVQVPQVLPRLVPLGQGDEPQQFILLEEAVSARLPELFGGFDVLSWTTFRITRDSDIELLEQESDDMLRLIEDRLKARQRGEAVRLEVAAGGSEDLLRMIIDEEVDARRRARRI